MKLLRLSRATESRVVDHSQTEAGQCNQLAWGEDHAQLQHVQIGQHLHAHGSHRLATDVHAPANFRALTVRNLDARYPAFDVKPGEKL